MDDDVMESSDGYFDEGDCPENLSISFESLYKILDEDPAPPISNSSAILEISHLKNLDCEREPMVLHPQPEFWPSEMGNSNSLDESLCNKPLFGHPFQHNGTYDCFSGPFYDETLDERNNSTSQHIESSGLFSYPAAQSSSWLRPSSTDLANSLIGSFDDSFGSFVTDDANFHKMQNNTTNCSFSLESAEEFGLIYQQHMNFTADANQDGLNGDLVNLDCETPLQNSFSKSINDMDNISSPCMLQMSEASLAHSTLTERYGSVSERSCGMNRDAMPSSTVQNRGIHTSFIACRTEDRAFPQQYEVSPERKCTEAINDYHVANNVSLTIPRDFLVMAEDVLRPSLSVPVTGLPHDDATLLCGENIKGVQLFLSKDSSECTWQEQSPHSSVLDDSAVDVHTLLPCGMCFQLCSCEDMGIMSESSTDSSPLPCNHKPMLLNDDLAIRKCISGHKIDLQRKQQKSFLKEKKQPPISTNHQQPQQLFELSRIASQSNSSRVNSTLNDDSDLFILDDISHPIPHALPSAALVNFLPVAERCSFSNHTSSGTIRTRPDDERLTFRLALQDLSQPKSEASPPDGVLAVPLLRHQRIALSWMVQKESAGLNCSGGILADDQGLGKTISTIALILTERSPSFSSSMNKKCEFEPLNLDDEDDGGGSIAFEGNRVEKLLDNGPSIHAKPEKTDCSLVPVNGRPPAGTLVVCPTSVLRQWADELENKTTDKANLSVLVYHGSSRTKDPYELAKFDVVITTYAIVSMEVPKQPLVDKDDMEREKRTGCSMLAGNFVGNKRKEPSSTSLKNSKRKIASDSSVLEFAPRPLAKVGWFRVILDEAQSIKNHRTQVARACWGLRAKRRWCLSGTPIQNAVDDLYSYFRFLRYDPYAVYKSFCSTIKIPISRNPINGYKKLQAVLKTVMLRRTKGTLIDGKPIISLPPKSVTLKKVDFSDDELEFYLALEAESREQFKVYAAAGTVKQNYVNILLMLLRLRQACDHPLLVKSTVSNSIWKSSLDTAKKLPMDKLLKLQTCLEACQAICIICNDPPEDAVVSICGHVFCNQCICEHLTGDDNICPSGNCRDKLSVGSVFSMDTLRRCLSQQTGPSFSSDNSVCDDNPISYVEHGPKNSQERFFCSSSSKIRAALQILNSLPLSNSSPSLCDSVKQCNESSVLLKNSVNTVSFGSSSYISSDQQSISKLSNVKHTEKAIVFSQWTRMLDLLEASLKTSCILYRRLDGTMSVTSREKAIKDFNRLPEVTVIIMSLKAASLGLNMVAACHVVLLDLWWNPTTEDQAIDRAHRIGQTRPVTVSRLTVKDTVEDRILSLQEKKRKMVASAFGEEGSGSQESRLTVEDLKYLFMV